LQIVEACRSFHALSPLLYRAECAPLRSLRFYATWLLVVRPGC
jgi:hypothetical protein